MRKKLRQQRQKQHDIFIAMLDGYNPITGEIFDKLSLWINQFIQNNLMDTIQGKHPACECRCHLEDKPIGNKIFETRVIYISEVKKWNQKSVMSVTF